MAACSRRVLTVQACGVCAPKAHGYQCGQQWRAGSMATIVCGGELAFWPAELPGAGVHCMHAWCLLPATTCTQLNTFEACMPAGVQRKDPRA